VRAIRASRLVRATAVVLSFAACRQAAPAGRARHAPTFEDDVAPILEAQCAPCHRPGHLAPFSLLTSADARAHASDIVAAVEARRMPPWLPEPGYADFQNARRLTGPQIDMIRRWVDGGMPGGSAREPARTPEPEKTWQLGQPDLIAALPQPYTLQAGATDVFRNFVIRVDIPHAVFVRGVEFHPGALHAVHHAVIGVDPTSASRRLDALDRDPGYEGMLSEEFHSPDGHFIGWTPGRAPFLEPPDMSWRLDPGTDLVVQMHLLPGAAPQRVDPEIGLYFGETPPVRVPFMVKLTSTTIDIPPGDAHYVVEDSYTLPVDVDALSVYPHAHYLAREIRADAALPDGTSRSLIWIRNWDFDRQDFYRYAAPVPLPAGTTVSMKYTYDNTGAHQRKHGQPPRRVVYGPRSSDEMADLWLQVLPRRPQDLDALARDFLRRSIDAGIRSAAKMVREDPASAPLQNLLGSRYLAAGRAEDAIAEFLAAVRRDPHYAEAQNNLGAALTAAGRAGEALPHLRAATVLRPDDDRVHFNMANALNETGRHAEAVREFTRSLAINPDSAEAHNNLAVLLGSQGRYDEAIDHLRRALALRERYPEAHHNLALALAANGNLDEALSHARRAVALRPNYPEAVESLRMLEWQRDAAGSGRR
jgi:Flp pilus assembly protein TadD